MISLRTSSQRQDPEPPPRDRSLRHPASPTTGGGIGGIHFSICPRCAMVVAIATPAKKALCPRCQSPIAARADQSPSTKLLSRRVA